jgi:hypothetical protein
MQRGNGSIYAVNPGRLLFGGSMLNEMKGAHCPQLGNVSMAFGPLASVPNGYRPPGAWIIARTNGKMAAYRTAKITTTATGVGALGLGGSGSASAQFSASGSGALIASGSGSAVATFAASGNGAGAIFGGGTGGATFTALATINALAAMSGLAVAEFSGEGNIYGLGWMSGTTVDPGGELTADAVAAAVWARCLEGAVTAQQIQQRIAAILTGKVSGGPDKPTFKAIGSDEDRVYMEADAKGNRTEVEFP